MMKLKLAMTDMSITANLFRIYTKRKKKTCAEKARLFRNYSF